MAAQVEPHRPPTNRARAVATKNGKEHPTRTSASSISAVISTMIPSKKIALPLRIRLKKDNSELIKQAIDDLYRKHNAKRAFGDA